jgi:starvation-inducible DNA-binding protein
MTEIIDSLNRNLAAMIALHVVAKHAHWNVRGQTFFAVHQLFDKIAEDAEGYADSIGETLGFFGEEAEGTPMLVAKSYLGPYSIGVDKAATHLRAILKCLEKSMAELKKGIDAALEKNDQVTADVFIEVSRGIGKNIYLAQSHLE